MKLAKKLMFGAAVLLTAGTLAAQGTYSSAADFVASPNIKDGEGVILAAGQNKITAKNSFDVDPAKTYTFSFDAKANGLSTTVYSPIQAGFRIFDAKGQEIKCWNVGWIEGSETVLAADAKKGDSFILVKDASKWNFQACTIVYDIKADKSDLPNYNMLGGDVKKIEKDGDNWKITLPVLVSMKAGTPVRAHAYGGLFRVINAQLLGKWVHYEGSITGTTTAGWNKKQWPVGTVKAIPCIFSNLDAKSESVEFKNITVTVK